MHVRFNYPASLGFQALDIQKKNQNIQKIISKHKFLVMTYICPCFTENTHICVYFL